MYQNHGMTQRGGAVTPPGGTFNFHFVSVNQWSSIKSVQHFAFKNEIFVQGNPYESSTASYPGQMGAYSAWDQGAEKLKEEDIRSKGSFGKQSLLGNLDFQIQASGSSDGTDAVNYRRMKILVEEKFTKFSGESRDAKEILRI